jgi:protein-S-isoprenylcysteine O-methyltransferase Ste14
MTARFLNRRFAGNYLSTLAFIALAYWVIADVSGFHRGALQGQWQFGVFGIDAVLTVHTLLLALIALYVVVLVPYYATYPWLHSKAFIFLQAAWFTLLRLRRTESRAHAARRARQPWHLPLRIAPSPAARLAMLALLLKFFFAPLMINWCLNHLGDMTGAVAQMIDGVRGGQRGRALFDASLFWALFQCILFADTLLFTLGYIVEVPALRNRIRSVDPTFFGWFVCLACYPPFNDFTGRFLQWQSSDFPYFQNDFVHVTANSVLLAAMAIYSWASIALGFKASNLTNRGIVSRGPYAWVRHPAYAAKNFAWWIGALPAFSVWFSSGDLQAALYSVFAMAGWTAIYVLRAITEERHLLMADNGYAEYMRRVRCRFIPGVI